jgi:alkanesulfonate monooxygenase SsuD/methylene tetrahydromethanopterin reductase-like flavin-dependent oxidoreductase (luciferase family)
VCDAVDAVLLREPDTTALRAAAERARRDGVDAVFLGDGPLGDAIVLASALGTWVDGILLGVRVGLATESHRYPTILAREMSSFDRVCGGRAVLALAGPFTEATGEAIGLCRDMWTKGIGVGVSPHYEAAGAINRPLPLRPGGPPIALDLTDGSVPPSALFARCDLVLVAAGTAPPASLPPGVEVCEIQDA